jgi:hypothetical protein|tara:strand:+ start:55766 stop:55945 length:180 start_codon:yes stop_codon:yes gene_type:complete
MSFMGKKVAERTQLNVHNVVTDGDKGQLQALDPLPWYMLTAAIQMPPYTPLAATASVPS